MKKVQEIVRRMPWFIWEPGFSVCYNNVSYTRTKRKRNFKFDLIGVKGGLEALRGQHGEAAWEKYQEISLKLETELKAALELEGHKVHLVSVGDGHVQVWMQDEPIQVTEVA